MDVALRWVKETAVDIDAARPWTVEVTKVAPKKT